jgi:hypothetical protein
MEYQAVNPHDSHKIRKDDDERPECIRCGRAGKELIEACDEVPEFAPQDTEDNLKLSEYYPWG